MYIYMCVYVCVCVFFFCVVPLVVGWGGVGWDGVGWGVVWCGVVLCEWREGR